MQKKKPVPMSIDALWALERLSAPSLSPDGSQAVCAVTAYDKGSNKTATHLWLLSTFGGAPRRLTTCGDKDRQALWSPQGDRIAFIGKRELAGKADATPQLYVIAADGGEASRVTNIAMGIETFKWMPDGKHVVCIAWLWPTLRGMAAQNKKFKEFSARRESGYVTTDSYYRYWDHNLPMDRVAHLVRVNIDTGEAVDLFEGTDYELPRAEPGATSFDISPDGKRIAFMHDPSTKKRASNRFALSELRISNRAVTTLVDNPKWDASFPSYAPHGKEIAFIATPQQPTHTMLGLLAVLDVNHRMRTFDAAWDRDVNPPLRWSPSGDSIYFTAEDRGRCHVWRRELDAMDKNAPTLVWQGGWVQGFDVAGDVATTAGEDVLAIASDAINHPVRIFAARLSGGESNVNAARIEQFNDERLAHLKFGDVQEVTVQGALGDDVQMWLVFPANFKRDKKHPLLQVIHGGPYAASGDTFGYRWNPHLLASQGHVVAMVNYHGSSGFGHAFRNSIMGRMGTLEMIDIEAGTDWLVKQKWVDRRRLYASGGSYGGFMVAWMNGHLPASRFRAYVCHAGVFDRRATWSADSYTQRPMDLHATYWDDPEKVAAQNPITFAHKMKTPTLIMHGALDYRVPDTNGLQYYNTLKARGVDTKLLWFPDENHWILKAANSYQWYGEFFAWLKSH